MRLTSSTPRNIGQLSAALMSVLLAAFLAARSAAFFRQLVRPTSAGGVLAAAALLA